MFCNNEVTKELLIAVLGANFVLLFFFYRLACCAARLYFRQVRRLSIAICKMDCDELIDVMLPCSGEQQQLLCNDEVTAGDNLAAPATPDACSGGTAGQQQLLRNDEVTAQSRQKPVAPDRMQNTVKGSPRLQRGSSRALWATCSRKSINRQPYRGAS